MLIAAFQLYFTMVDTQDSCSFCIQKGQVHLWVTISVALLYSIEMVVLLADH